MEFRIADTFVDSLAKLSNEDQKLVKTTFKPAGLKVRWFQLGTQQVHILLGAENQPDAQHHMALQVDDAQSARSWMKQHDIYIEETVLIPGAERFFIRDPFDNLIEIIEWKESYPNIPVGNST